MSDKNIPSNTFKNQTTITQVEFGNNCVNIGENAFEGCVLLKNINKNNSIKTICEYAFKNCEHLEEVVLPNCEEIRDNAFEKCKSLKKIELTLNEKGEIHYNAFLDCENLKKVNIKNHVNIGENAFENCISLEQVNMELDNNYNENMIGSNVFKNCKNLKEINVKNRVNIGKNAFKNLESLNKVVIDIDNINFDKINTIDNYAFYNCKNLLEVNMQNYVDIYNYVFIGCSKLKQAIIPNCKEIGISAFENCSSLEQVDVKNCETINQKAFFNCSGLTQINIPNCKKIGINAFENCSSLKQVNVNNIVDIEERAFLNCSKLSDINFDNVKKIGNSAFENCINLYRANLDFYLNTNDKENLLGKTPYIINQTNTDIDFITNSGYIFRPASEYKNLIHLGPILLELKPFCPILVKFIFTRENIDDIIYTWFMDKSLKDVLEEINIKLENYKTPFDILRNIAIIIIKVYEPIDMYIDNGYYGYGNTNVNIAKTSIGAKAFYNCEELTILTLSNCEYIDQDAFNGCINLKRVYIKDSPIFCELHNNTIFGDPNDGNFNTIFYFNQNVIDDYREHPEFKWEKYLNYMLPILENNKIMYTYKSYSYGDDIVFDDVSYETEVFPGKYGIITFNYKVKYLNQIFKGLDRLTSVDLPTECERITESAFEGCKDLTYIIPSNVLKNIDDYAFKDCESLSSFMIPESVVELEEGIFAGCKSLEKVYGKFTTYNEKAVVYNNNLIFYSPTDITNIISLSTIDENIKRLGKYCFYGCKNLKTVYIPSTVLSIGNYAFQNCEELESVYFLGLPPILGIKVFENVNKDFKIYVPKEYINLYKGIYEDEGYADMINSIN